MDFKIVDANEAKDITKKAMPLISKKIIRYVMNSIMESAEFGINHTTIYKDEIRGYDEEYEAPYWEECCSDRFIKWIERLGYFCVKSSDKITISWK